MKVIYNAAGTTDIQEIIRNGSSLPYPTFITRLADKKVNARTVASHAKRLCSLLDGEAAAAKAAELAEKEAVAVPTEIDSNVMRAMRFISQDLKLGENNVTAESTPAEVVEALAIISERTAELSTARSTFIATAMKEGLDSEAAINAAQEAYSIDGPRFFGSRYS